MHSPEKQNINSKNAPHVLQTIHDKINRETKHLPQAFLLATMCKLAVQSMAEIKEIKTYGDVRAFGICESWDEVINRLRTVLFFSMRLRGGEKMLSCRDMFENGKTSFYELIAKDELNISLKVSDSSSLESLCICSRKIALDRTDSKDWKHMQLSVKANKEERKMRFFFMRDGRER